MNKKYWLTICYLEIILCLLFFTCSIDVNAEIVRRAAFDFGSGKIKLQVADVDTDKHVILKSIYAESIPVELIEDAANNPEGYFSEEIQNQAINTAQKLKMKAIELGALEFVGLATEAYRNAPNGQKLADRYYSELDIPVKIISQLDEGRFGFLAIVAETNLDSTHLISWDIGGGSFQIAYLDQENNIQVYMAPLGRITTKNAIIKFIKEEDPLHLSSPNPVSNADWENALFYFNTALPEVPNSLVLKLKTPDVQLVGMSAHPDQLRNLKTYHLDDIGVILEERLNKSDDELAQIHESPPTAVSELALVYSVMYKLNVSTVNYKRTSSGFTSGLLISEEFWTAENSFATP